MDCHLQTIAVLAFTLPSNANAWKRPAAKDPPIEMENIMKRRMIMILASAALAGSLLATGAQARGGGGGGGHMGGFGGGHIGGLGVHPGGLDGGNGGGFGARAMAHVDHDHVGLEGVVSLEMAFTATASIVPTTLRTLRRIPAPIDRGGNHEADDDYLLLLCSPRRMAISTPALRVGQTREA